jgi:hypothetical protein
LHFKSSLSLSLTLDFLILHKGISRASTPPPTLRVCGPAQEILDEVLSVIDSSGRLLPSTLKKHTPSRVLQEEDEEEPGTVY